MKSVIKTRVPFSATGVVRGLSVIGAAHIIEDNVCAFFATFGRDSASIKAKFNAVWMFVKNKIRFSADTVWNEEITVETFFTEISAAKVITDTVIKNAKGETAVYARTEICAIDLSTGRVRRISSLDLPENAVEQSPSDLEFTRFDAFNGEKTGEIKVPSTAIDFCHHVNNVEYLRFILNAAAVEKEVAHPVKEVEIHYLSQAREGDELALFFVENGGKELYKLKNGDKEVVRCGIVR